MAKFTCPFCQCTMALSKDNHKTHYISEKYFGASTDPPTPGQIKIDYYSCPHCQEVSVVINVECEPQPRTIPIIPASFAKKYPDYIPVAIRKDYEEACSIVHLSPKASATLSRRCLQGMIRDFWEIRESNLSKSINKLERLIPVQQWHVINGIRRIGNIGAHMEMDIDLIIEIEPDEAQKLLKLIEHLLEQWYINRHEQELLYADIIDIDEAKQISRKKTE